MACCRPRTGTTLEIHIDDLKKVANFCCESGQHGIVWPVMVGEFWFLGEEERIRGTGRGAGRGQRTPARSLRLFRDLGAAGAALCESGAKSRGGFDYRHDAGAHRRGHGNGHVPAAWLECSTDQSWCKMPTCTHRCAASRWRKLVDEIPQVEYVKEERQPGPKHIAEVAEMVGDRVKCIFGGAAGKFLPDEMRRGANGNMPACELADVLAKITELWWAGQEEDARAMHRRLLPLIILENHPFMRYILKRRGVFSTLVERAPAGKLALDEGDKREIETLLETIAEDIESFPILPER